MGNICCQNKVRDLNIKKTIFIKKEFDISIYNPIILGDGVSGNSYKLKINNKLLTCKKVKKEHFNKKFTIFTRRLFRDCKRCFQYRVWNRNNKRQRNTSSRRFKILFPRTSRN